MSKRPHRVTLLICVCLLLVVSAGCLADERNEELPEREAVATSLDSVDTVEATATMEMHIGNSTTDVEMDFVERTSTREFRATMDMDSPDVTLRMVSNGTTVWLYNQSSNDVSTLRMEGMTADWNRSIEAVSGIFAALKQSSTDEAVSISPLPIVPGGGASSAIGVSSMPAIGNVSLTYQGTATAAGRTSHVVDLAPAGDGSLVRNGTIWLDADRYYPIKVHYDMAVGGQPVSITVAYRNLTYNPEVPEGTFTFDPPANATETGDSRSVSAYRTRVELVEAATQSVPEPELPAGYEFAQASRVAGDGNRSLSIQYSNGNRTIVVAKDSAGAATLPDGETVDVGDRDGVYLETGGTAALVWDCPDARYQVTGNFEAATLADVAESVACE